MRASISIKGPTVARYQFDFCTYTRSPSITHKHAIETIERADQSHVIRVDDATLILSLRHISVRPPFSLLIISRPIGDDVVRIEHGLKIYHDLTADFVSLSPLQALEALVRRFGFPLRIGKEVSLLFLEKTVPLAQVSKDRLIEIVNPENDKFVIASYLRQKADKQTFTAVLAFAIDIRMYSAWLNQPR